MIIDTDLLQALAASDLCSDYYGLCSDHPARLDRPGPTMNAKQIVETACGRIGIEKLSGPGRVYRLLAPADGIALNCIIGSSGYVETDLKMHHVGERSTFAILCNQIHQLQTGVTPDPPYQRPRCVAPGELIAIMIRLAELTFVLAAKLPTSKLGND